MSKPFKNLGTPKAASSKGQVETQTVPSVPRANNVQVNEERCDSTPEKNPTLPNLPVENTPDGGKPMKL